jgi:3-deoxy-D-manno-octulosonic acid kinase
VIVPPGLAAVTSRVAWGFAAPEARDWVIEAIEKGQRLRDVAAAHPHVLELRGRGAVYAVPAPGGRWVVRPYRRGGAVARPLLGDRYVRLGSPRPFVEAAASVEAARRGISTPRVVAGLVYPDGPFYRADPVTEYIGGAANLADTLWSGPLSLRLPRARALRAAGRLLGSMARAGVEHVDLNAGNILLRGEGENLSAMLLDLDRCLLKPHGAGSFPRMFARLERSLRKLGERAGEPLSGEDFETLRHPQGGG